MTIHTLNSYDFKHTINNKLKYIHIQTTAKNEFKKMSLAIRVHLNDIIKCLGRKQQILKNIKHA